MSTVNQKSHSLQHLKEVFTYTYTEDRCRMAIVVFTQIKTSNGLLAVEDKCAKFLSY